MVVRGNCCYWVLPFVLGSLLCLGCGGGDERDGGANGGSGGNGGAAGTGGSGGTGGGGSPTPDVYADAVDDALTEINDDGCLGNCIGDPPNAIGAPDFAPGGGGTVSLGPGGMLGLVFVDELCVVDDDDGTPDIVVYEQGGVQVEDFALRFVLVGETELESGVVQSRSSVDQPERSLDLTSVIGPSVVERVLIIDLDDAQDEPEEPGFEVGWGADIDAVGCFSGRQ